MNRAEELRRLLINPPVVCVGAYDAMTARIAEKAGAKVIYISGYAASAARLATPDLGLITQSEMCEHIVRICNATKCPVIADADTGYGGVLNVQRTVELWESAGVSGLHLEDQVFPKRCGHMAGKAVVPAKDMVQKIKATQKARQNRNFLIIARTDALAVEGLPSAIDRCRAYAEAGADALFVDAPESLEQLDLISKALVGKLLVFNSARTKKSPVVSVNELRRRGFNIVLYPIEALLVAHHAVTKAYERLLVGGSTDAIAHEMTSFNDFNIFLDLPEYLRNESAFALEG